MLYAYYCKKYILVVCISLITFFARANQYTIVNKSESEVTLYFGPEKNLDNYPAIYSVVANETKTINTSFTAQTIKCKAKNKTVSFVYPNTSCQNILVQIEDNNTDLVVSAHCN